MFEAPFKDLVIAVRAIAGHARRISERMIPGEYHSRLRDIRDVIQSMDSHSPVKLKAKLDGEPGTIEAFVGDGRVVWTAGDGSWQVVHIDDVAPDGVGL